MNLKARPDEQALLLDLQRLDTSLQQLEHRAKNLPENALLREVEAQNVALRARLTTEEGVLDDAQRELTRLESDVAVVEARITRDRDRLQGTSSQKDIQALEQELAALLTRRGDLDERQLEVMERVEAAAAITAATLAEAQALAERRTEAETTRAATLVSIDADRAQTVADRATIATRVPDDLLALYERQRSRYGIGASHLRAGISSASGVALTGSDLATVRAAAPDDVLLCPDSDAILVRTDESGL